MAETQLITLSDVQAFRRVDVKFDTNRFNTFVTEVQRKNLRNLLKDALYYDFMISDRTTGVYADLLNGKSYQYSGQTIQFYGVKPALCYWWLAVAAREGDLFMSNYGAVQFVNNPQQHFETSKEKERIAVQYMETAQNYANDITKFLNQNSSLYPLWATDFEKQTKNYISFRL